jgi:hypothetical protein
MPDVPYETLVASLGILSHRETDHVAAAIGLVIKEGWPRRRDFVDAAVRWDDDQAWIRWDLARQFLDSSPTGSTTELTILDLAITLAEDRFRLASKGLTHRRWIADAVAEAVGLAGPEL